VTKDAVWIVDALFHGSWPKLSTLALETCFENAHFIFCSSLPNEDLGGVKYNLIHRAIATLPKSSFARVAIAHGVAAL